MQSVVVHKPGEESPTYGWNNAVWGLLPCVSLSLLLVEDASARIVSGICNPWLVHLDFSVMFMARQTVCSLTGHRLELLNLFRGPNGVFAQGPEESYFL